MKQITTSQEKKSQVRSVLLLTDGLANKGVTATADILEEIKRVQEKNFSSELSLGTLHERRLTLVETRTLQKESMSPSFALDITPRPSQITSPPLNYGSQALMSPQEQPLEEATASVLPSTNSISNSVVHVTEEVDDSLRTKSSLKMVKLHDLRAL